MLKLLDKRPLSLQEVVRAIASEPAMAAAVLQAALEEHGATAATLESAVVLLGADRIRLAVATLAGQSAGRGKRVSGKKIPSPGKARGAGMPAQQRRLASRAEEKDRSPQAHKVQRLRAAIRLRQYRLDSEAIASAMLREFAG